MTVKQVIINDVDVSNCKYYVENNGVEYQGCYQLNAKEQKLIKIKQYIEDLLA